MRQSSRPNRDSYLVASVANERGSALVIAILILAVLTIIGISSTTTSRVEVQISGNDKSHKIAFHNADAGVYTVAKVISKSMNDKATPFLNLVSSFTYADPGTDDTSSGHTFFRELAGFESYDADSDISFTNDGKHIINVDVERLKSVNISGGGAEFASGMEGHGTSLKGIYFGLDSFGQGPSNALSNVGARYLKVLGTAGGI